MTTLNQPTDTQALEMAALQVAQGFGLSIHFDRDNYESGGISAYLAEEGMDLKGKDVWLIKLHVSSDATKKFEYHVQPLMRFDDEEFQWTQFFVRLEGKRIISPWQRWVAENAGRHDNECLDPVYLDYVRHTFDSVQKSRELRKTNEARYASMKNLINADQDGNFEVGDLRGRLFSQGPHSETSFRVEMNIPINNEDELEELLSVLRQHNDRKSAITPFRP